MIYVFSFIHVFFDNFFMVHRLVDDSVDIGAQASAERISFP